MELTHQMQAEIETIRIRTMQIHDEVLLPLRREMLRCRGISTESMKYGNAIIEEMNTYKVRLENILCETDIKERVRSKAADDGSKVADV